MELLSDEIDKSLQSGKFVSYSNIKKRLKSIHAISLASKDDAWLLQLKLDFTFKKLFNSNLLVFDE